MHGGPAFSVMGASDGLSTSRRGKSAPCGVHALACSQDDSTLNARQLVYVVYHARMCLCVWNMRLLQQVW